MTPAAPVTTRRFLDDAEVRGEARVVAGEAGLDRWLTHARIQKSGLGLAGHMHGIVPSRVQILGETELSYVESLPSETRRIRLTAMLGLGLSCVIVTRGVEPLPELIEAAQATDTPLVVMRPRSSATIALVHAALDRLLAPRATVHGVMVEVHGVGILLDGKSGIGKSECALFLIQRGHRLVADDQVDLVRLPGDVVVASSPPLLRHHLEIRGLGILPVRELFGATAVRDAMQLDLVIELKSTTDGEEVDRLGLDDTRRDVLGVSIPVRTIPVRPGRDMGTLLEVAARNELLRRTGHNPAQAFIDRIERKTGARS